MLKPFSIIIKKDFNLLYHSLDVCFELYSLFKYENKIEKIKVFKPLRLFNIYLFLDKAIVDSDPSPFGITLKEKEPVATTIDNPGTSNPKPSPRKWRDLFTSNYNIENYPKLVHFDEISIKKQGAILEEDLDTKCYI
ncbi:hypothetical protein NC651_002052 [Populus alba x Populus x berolinensis]|nr:hypothetical protein NC651_002052 [Populus alba x Populus x berolinensis]